LQASLSACVADPVSGHVAARPHRATEVDLCWIARRLGLLDFERRTIIGKVRLLAEQCSFPLPKNPRFVKGARHRPEAIDAFSIWDRDPVELWIEDDRPPAESAALVAARRSTVAEEMARRASNIVQLVAANG
jgi:hypothetical protein